MRLQRRLSEANTSQRGFNINNIPFFLEDFSPLVDNPKRLGFSQSTFLEEMLLEEFVVRLVRVVLLKELFLGRTLCSCMAR